MLATQQVVEGEDQWSTLPEMRENACCTVSEDSASECSTVFGNQDVDAQNDAGNVSDCHSDCQPEAEALIIFDWDDTLFPTSWIQEQGLLADGATISTQQEAQLDMVADQVRSTLNIALKLGKVVIVTNAEQGWIEASCTRFTPSLASLLKTIDMVSARSSFEHCTNAPSEWKRMAFAHEVDLFYGSGRAGQRRNILSVGDSLHEQQALVSLIGSKCTPHSSGKSIKLFEVPSIESVIEQHELLAGCLKDLVEHDGDLDVEIGADALE